MKKLLTLLLLCCSISAAAQRDTVKINERLTWLNKSFGSRTLPVEQSDLLYNIADMYALKGKNDSAFHFLFKAVDKCPDTAAICKEIYNADILGNICYTHLHQTANWKKFKARIIKGFYRMNGKTAKPQLAYDLMIAKGIDQSSIIYAKYLTAQEQADMVQKRLSNNSFIRKVIVQHGYPTISMVGSDASHAAFLLCQHFDEDLPFQKKVLQLMQQAGDDVDKKHIAYLTDRIMVSEGETQLYGTQFRDLKEKTLYPIKDSADVDKRRQAMGLSTLEEYKNSVWVP